MHRIDRRHSQNIQELAQSTLTQIV